VFSNTVSLAQCPDKLIVQIRPTAAYTPAEDDWTLSLSNVSLIWANQSGLLSSAAQTTLYRISQENGLDQDEKKGLPIDAPQRGSRPGSVACLR
jgi:hypothetical protein